MCEIVETIGTLYDAVISISNDHLGIGKLSATWVPRLLTIVHNRNRMTTSKKFWVLFNRNPDEFLRPLITADKKWIL